MGVFPGKAVANVTIYRPRPKEIRKYLGYLSNCNVPERFMLDYTDQLHLHLPSGLFPSVITTTVLYVIPIFPTRDTIPSRLQYKVLNNKI